MTSFNLVTQAFRNSRAFGAALLFIPLRLTRGNAHMESNSLSSSRQSINSSLNVSANASSRRCFAVSEASSSASPVPFASTRAERSFTASTSALTKACISRNMPSISSIPSSGQSRHVCKNTAFMTIESGHASAAARAAFFASSNFFATISCRVWSRASRWARRTRAYRTSGCEGFPSTSLSSSFVARARAPFLVKIS